MDAFWCIAVAAVRRVRPRPLSDGRWITALSDVPSPFCAIAPGLHSLLSMLLCVSDLENGLWACDKPRTVYEIEYLRAIRPKEIQRQIARR
eukprot:COSAG02_NODE_1997_length_10152_cov_3.110315_2_plen_91_part_00